MEFIKFYRRWKKRKWGERSNIHNSEVGLMKLKI